MVIIPFLEIQSDSLESLLAYSNLLPISPVVSTTQAFSSSPPRPLLDFLSLSWLCAVLVIPWLPQMPSFPLSITRTVILHTYAQQRTLPGRRTSDRWLHIAFHQQEMQWEAHFSLLDTRVRSGMRTLYSLSSSANGPPHTHTMKYESKTVLEAFSCLEKALTQFVSGGEELPCIAVFGCNLTAT